jgi:hypothetical protein
MLQSAYNKEARVDTIRITLDLPANFVQEAESFDLLDPKVVESLLREELDRRIMAFVNEEVKSYRSQKRSKKENQPPED